MRGAKDTQTFLTGEKLPGVSLGWAYFLSSGFIRKEPVDAILGLGNGLFFFVRHAVRVTLGPKSKSVLIQKKWGTPIVCNDGVTIAKEVDLKDPEENLGAQNRPRPDEPSDRSLSRSGPDRTALKSAVE